MPETPDSWAQLTDPRPAARDPPPAKLDLRASYAEVVRRGRFNAPLRQAAQRHRNEAQRASSRGNNIYSAEVTRTQRIYSSKASRIGRAWMPRQAPTRHAAQALAQQGWTPAKRRRRHSSQRALPNPLRCEPLQGGASIVWPRTIVLLPGALLLLPPLRSPGAVL